MSLKAECRRPPATSISSASRISYTARTALRSLLAGLVLAGAVALIVVARHAPPFREISDGAVLEIYTLEALKGRLLVGPYSRFGWHHPGPLYFYLQAPWYWMSGYHTAGMQAGALAINLAAVGALVWVAAELASPAMAAWVCAATAWYVLRARDLLTSAWNPHVIILPMLAFVMIAAAFAVNGRRGFLLCLVAVGSFLVQTHLALAPLVAALGLVALVRQRRQGWRVWACATCVAIALWLPPLVDELTHVRGNISRITSFFVAGSTSAQPMATAISAWSGSLTSVFRDDFQVAIGLDVRPVLTAWPLAGSMAQLIGLLGVVILTRRRDRFAAWLATMCLIGSAVALLSILRIHDQLVDHEIFWITALGAVNVGVIAGALAAAASATLHRRRSIPNAVGRVAAIAACLIAVGTGLAGMREVLHRTRTPDDHAVDVLADEAQRLVSEMHSRRPLFHIEPPVWPIAAGALLQLDKAHLRFAVDDRWTTMFGEAFAPNGREDANLTMTGSPVQPRLIVDR